MKPLTLQEVVDALDGTLDRPVPIGNVKRVVTDSREVQAGDLFVAIRGPHFDGHDFADRAFAAGAVAAVVRSDFPHARADAVADASTGPVPMLIRVEEPVVALGRLARYYRQSVINGGVTIVAVTGSNGKTTTKSMIAHVLSGRWKGRASPKSYNNQIGVPLTLLASEPSEEFVVCEVGTNAPGEISALARLIEPEIAVITGIAPVHLEGLGSLDNIAAEKLSLLGALRPDGCAVVNADHEILRWTLAQQRDWTACKKVTFGAWEQADLRLTAWRMLTGAADAPLGVQEFTVNDRFVYRLHVPGRHNVFNAMAAIGVARRFGMSDAEVAERLASFRLPPMRLGYERAGPVTIINDAYNANPASVTAAVDVLEQAPAAGRRVLVLGDMRELGEASGSLHEEVARRIGAGRIDMVIAVGGHARLVRDVVRRTSGRRIETHAYGSTALARRRVASLVVPGDTILVKGSRLLALERLVEVIRKRAAGMDSRPKTESGKSRRRPCR